MTRWRCLRERIPHRRNSNLIVSLDYCFSARLNRFDILFKLIFVLSVCCCGKLDVMLKEIFNNDKVMRLNYQVYKGNTQDNFKDTGSEIILLGKIC